MANSTASEIAMPSEPQQAGSLARICAAGCRLAAGTGGDLRPKGLHQRFAIGLLVIADPHHKDFAFQAEGRAGDCQG